MHVCGEYRSILKYRLMIPMYPEDETCPICRKACMDKYGEHAVHCKELPGPYGREIYSAASGSARLWLGWGKHACVDLTGVSPLVGLRENGFVAGQAARKAESKKVDKHAKACAENQHVFVPFAFDTFGSLASEAIHFLTRVQRVIHNNCSTPRGQEFVFGRLGFAIQKGLAAQLVARLPAVLISIREAPHAVIAAEAPPNPPGRSSWLESKTCQPTVLEKNRTESFNLAA
ncbi:hypothetical protein R6Q59_023519 [Mikania micrantha]